MISLFYLKAELTPPQEASVDICSQPDGLQKCHAAQRVLDPFIPVEEWHEFLPDCEKAPGPSQHFQVSEWMASIDGKELYDTFNRRMEEKQLSTTQKGAKTSPNIQKQKNQLEKETKSSENWQM
ncbi:hypothetical protein O181_034403 [Austropuccinia psidii MF-1]|uniref:Uncharacterized protein n=1 Tax=Austropuccinia psidii MF-1 TaxID=1389203 RepID=A0A9Q3D3E3_9BASI|nr:hypothetical protein [Austropuccinia psidii MF-1]